MAVRTWNYAGGGVGDGSVTGNWSGNTVPVNGDWVVIPSSKDGCDLTTLAGLNALGTLEIAADAVKPNKVVKYGVGGASTIGTLTQYAGDLTLYADVTVTTALTPEGGKVLSGSGTKSLTLDGFTGADIPATKTWQVEVPFYDKVIFSVTGTLAKGDGDLYVGGSTASGTFQYNNGGALTKVGGATTKVVVGAAGQYGNAVVGSGFSGSNSCDLDVESSGTIKFGSDVLANTYGDYSHSATLITTLSGSSMTVRGWCNITATINGTGSTLAFPSHANQHAATRVYGNVTDNGGVIDARTGTSAYIQYLKIFGNLNLNASTVKASVVWPTPTPTLPRLRVPLEDILDVTGTLTFNDNTCRYETTEYNRPASYPSDSSSVVVTGAPLAGNGDFGTYVLPSGFTSTITYGGANITLSW